MPERPGLARLLIVVAIALLVGWQVVRQAAVDRFSDDAPAIAARFWASHPDVASKIDLDAIATAVAAGQPVPRDRIEQIMALSTRAPLAPEPLLVRGVDAGLTGQPGAAERAFLAAKQRAPMSRAARYFLADHYLKTNQPQKGLVELGALTRMIPGSAETLAPQYAAYARQPGGPAQIKQLLTRQPELAPPILTNLAKDPVNAGLVLALSADLPRNAGPFPWEPTLVDSLLTAGNFAEARRIWGVMAGVPSATLADNLIVDPSFDGELKPVPFGWTLNSGGSGIAEPTGNGQLQVIFYGRENVVLASQTLLLAPGEYRLSFKLEGNAADAKALAWKVSCRPAGNEILSVDLANAGRGESGQRSFTVAPNCVAQQLYLAGYAPEFPKTIDVQVGELSLARIGR
jgi:hypothetical protein